LSNDGYEAAKPAQAATAKHEFTLLAGGTIAITPDNAEGSGWRVLLVPTHGLTETIYYGNSDWATRIFTIADAIQHKANETGKAQTITVTNDGVAVDIDNPIEN
jgi:hypothetical protein